MAVIGATVGVAAAILVAARRESREPVAPVSPVEPTPPPEPTTPTAPDPVGTQEDVTRE
jgi:hypothetical protein